MSVPSSIQHQARLAAAQTERKRTKPNGNYNHGEHQWGVVAAVNDGPPPTVDLWLDGSQMTNDPANITTGVSYIDSYSPQIDDVVLVYRGLGQGRTSRVVLGNLTGSATPYPVLLGGLGSDSRFFQGPNALWGGPGEPLDSLGMDGDLYWRTDTPNIANQQFYYRFGGGWAPLGGGGGGGGVTGLLAGANVTLTPPGGTGEVQIDVNVPVNNIVAGPGVVVTDDGAGDFTISATFSGGPAGGDLGGSYPDPVLTNTPNVQSIDYANFLNASLVAGAGSSIQMNADDYLLVDTTSFSIGLSFPCDLSTGVALNPPNLTKAGIQQVAVNPGSWVVMQTVDGSTFFDTGTTYYTTIIGGTVGRKINWMFYNNVWYTLYDSANSGAGTVTDVAVATANGFAGTSSGGAIPALTLQTTVTGVLKGNGTAISAATAGTDYASGQSIQPMLRRIAI